MASNLKFILESGEDHKTEFKESISSGLDKEMVAFANSEGGKIYIGITDKGKIKGVEITNRLKSQIYDMARNCDKSSVSIEEMKKEKVLVVTVKEGSKKPYSCSSGYYIRSGSNSQKLSTEELRDFMREEGLIE